MTDSHRKRPYAAWCGGSQKRDKQICNRIRRHAGRIALHVHGEDAAYLHREQALNSWCMPQDGTRHYVPWSQSLLDYRQWYRWVLAK